MVDSVHARHQASSASDSDATTKPGKGFASACFAIFAFAIAFGVFVGLASKHQTRVEQVSGGIAIALFSLFLGMVMWEMVWRDRLKRSQKNVDETARAIHRVAIEALHSQSDAYEKMIRAATKAVSMRVASRMVVEMMPSMENEEQRDAAYDRAGDIVVDEMQSVLGAVSEKTGALKAKLSSCQSESSEG